MLYPTPVIITYSVSVSLSHHSECRVLYYILVKPMTLKGGKYKAVVSFLVPAATVWSTTFKAN